MSFDGIEWAAEFLISRSREFQRVLEMIQAAEVWDKLEVMDAFVITINNALKTKQHLEIIKLC